MHFKSARWVRRAFCTRSWAATRSFKIERVARAARVRDSLLSLKGAALQMEHDDRMAFAELVELARAEHHAANHDQECQIEIEAAVANVTMSWVSWPGWVS